MHLWRLIDNTYDFIIADNGISIRNSFKNAGYPFENDCDALIKAVNGLSTKNDLGYIERGTGLNNTINIIVNGINGEFLLISCNALLILTLKKSYLKKFLKNIIMEQSSILESS